MSILRYKYKASSLSSDASIVPHSCLFIYGVKVMRKLRTIELHDIEDPMSKQCNITSLIGLLHDTTTFVIVRFRQMKRLKTLFD